MCGLEVVVGDCSVKDERIFKTMLIWNQIRGFDSTGVASVAKHGTKDNREIRLAKELGPPNYLMDLKSFDKCFYGTNQLFLGHNRSKTTGEITRRNAHPFLFEDIVGAHNGTISAASKNRLEAGHSFKTDSEAIFNNIQLHGIQDTIARIDKGSDNSFVLLWYDKRDNTFNLLRNEHRPFLYTYSKSHRTLYGSSLYETLIGAIDLEDVDRDAKPYQPNPDTWYKWVIPANTWDTLPEPVREKIEYRKSASSSYFPGKKNNKSSSEGSGGSSGTNTEFSWPGGEEYGDWEGSYEGFGAGAYQQLPTNNQTKDVTTDADGNTTVNPVEVTEGDAPFDPDTTSGEREEMITRIQDAYKALEDKTGALTTVESTKVKETSLTDSDDIRQAKYKGMQDLGIVRKERFPKIYSGKSLIVHRDGDTNDWVSLRWNAERSEWDRFATKKPPVDMPFNILDIDARHQFAHEGKGKNKQIFYKGFRGAKLDQEHFTKVMQQKCMGCDRIPEWGNLVHFVDDSHNYLCEYCGMYDNGGLVRELIQDRKKVG